MGAESTQEAIQLRKELEQLVQLGGFNLQNWNCNKGDVLVNIPEHLKDLKTRQEIYHQDKYTKVLGVEWNMVSDCFHCLISCSEVGEPLTK